jgi:predicted Holliday junction resolvase-like endonuclease
MPIRLKDAGLFHLDDFTDEAIAVYEEYLNELKERRNELKAKKKDITEKSTVVTKSVNVGFILERLAPSLESFKFHKNDCRSLFDPIDYVIFEGLASKGEITKVIFSDIKTGNARLNSCQKQIKKLVEEKKVNFDVYEVLENEK